MRQTLVGFGSRWRIASIPTSFSRTGNDLVVPRDDERAYIHEKYVTGLVNGILLPRTREGFLRIVYIIQERDHVEVIVLAGTEVH
jgi:aspartate/glutamate racemase